MRFRFRNQGNSFEYSQSIDYLRSLDFGTTLVHVSLLGNAFTYAVGSQDRMSLDGVSFTFCFEIELIQYSLSHAVIPSLRFQFRRSL